MQCVVTEAQVFISVLDGKLFLNSFLPVSSRLCARGHVCAREGVRVRCLSREKKVCVQISCPWNILSQLWPLKHLMGPEGGTGGGRGEG